MNIEGIDRFFEWRNRDDAQFTQIRGLLESHPDYQGYDSSVGRLRNERPNRFDGATAAVLDLGDVILTSKVLGTLGNRLYVTRTRFEDSQTIIIQGRKALECETYTVFDAQDDLLTALETSVLVSAAASDSEPRIAYLEALAHGEDSRTSARAAQRWWREDVYFAHLLNALLRRDGRTVMTVQTEIAVPSSKLYQYLTRRGVKFEARPRRTAKVMAMVCDDSGRVFEDKLPCTILQDTGTGLPPKAWLEVEGAPGRWLAEWSPASWCYRLRATLPALGLVRLPVAIQILCARHHLTPTEAMFMIRNAQGLKGQRVYLAAVTEPTRSPVITAPSAQRTYA